MHYVDLVVVTLSNNKEYLFRAPAWSHLSPDENVYVDTEIGKAYGTVVGSFTTGVDLDESEAQLLIKMLHATLPLKRVLERVVNVKINYDNDPYEELNYEQAEQTKEQEA